MTTFRNKKLSLVGIFLVLFLVLIPLVAAAPAGDLEARKGKNKDKDKDKCKCTKSRVNKLAFKVSMDTFQKYRKKNSCCDFSSDGCSHMPDNPKGFKFLPACQRHDFAYRNTKDQDRFTEDMRKKIDDNFKDDMYKVCSQFSGWMSLTGVECRRVADTYHGLVRGCGDGKCQDAAKGILGGLFF